MSPYSIVKIANRKEFLEKVAADPDLLNGLRGNPDSSRLYDEILRHSDLDKIPEKTWHRFEMESFGVVVEKYPTGPYLALVISERK